MGERKVKVEIRIGCDEDGDWWTVLMVDDNEAQWRGPCEHRAAAEKAGFNLAAEIDHLNDEAIRRIPEKRLANSTLKRGLCLCLPTVVFDGRAPPGRLRSPVRSTIHFVNLVMALRRAHREPLRDFLLIVSKCLATIDQWLHCTVQFQ